MGVLDQRHGRYPARDIVQVKGLIARRAVCDFRSSESKMGSRSPSPNDDVSPQSTTDRGQGYSRDVGAGNHEPPPGLGPFHNAWDFAAQGVRPMPSMIPKGVDGNGEDGGSNGDRLPRPHVHYQDDNSMDTNPVRMDTLSTVSSADLPRVRRRSTVRSSIFKTVDDFQDFDVGGPGWHRTQTSTIDFPGLHADYDSK